MFVGASTLAMRGVTTGFAVIAAVLVLVSAAMVWRWPGWRIVAGCLAWLLIATGVLGGLGQLGEIPAPFDAISFYRLWRIVMPAVLAVAFGYSILWAKRHEPRRMVADKAKAAP